MAVKLFPLSSKNCRASSNCYLFGSLFDPSRLVRLAEPAKPLARAASQSLGRVPTPWKYWPTIPLWAASRTCCCIRNPRGHPDRPGRRTRRYSVASLAEPDAFATAPLRPRRCRLHRDRDLGHPQTAQALDLAAARSPTRAPHSRGLSRSAPPGTPRHRAQRPYANRDRRPAPRPRSRRVADDQQDARRTAHGHYLNEDILE